MRIKLTTPKQLADKANKINYDLKNKEHKLSIMLLFKSLLLKFRF